MNGVQRAILVCGAVAVASVFYTTPRVVFLDGKMYRDIPSNHRYARVVDVRTVGAILAGVVVATIFLFVAASSNRRMRDRVEVVENRIEKLTKDVAALESDATEPHLVQPKPFS